MFCGMWCLFAKNRCIVKSKLIDEFLKYRKHWKILREIRSLTAINRINYFLYINSNPRIWKDVPSYSIIYLNINEPVSYQIGGVKRQLSFITMEQFIKQRCALKLIWCSVRCFEELRIEQIMIIWKIFRESPWSIKSVIWSFSAESTIDSDWWNSVRENLLSSCFYHTRVDI